MLLDSTTHLPEKPRSSKAVVAARKAEIARRYAAKRSAFDLAKLIAGKRRNEIEALIRYRYGNLPDTDDRDVLLCLWAAHNQRSAHPQGALIELARRLGAHLSKAEAETVVSYVARFPRRYKARTLGKLLQLTEAERDACGITTIEAVDVTPEQRKRVGRAKHASVKRQRRRARGMQARAQYLEDALSQTRPWEAERICRRTWERRRRKAAQGACRKSVPRQCTEHIAWGHTCDTSRAERTQAVVAVIRANIEPAGDRVILRAGASAIPAGLVGRIREAKAELLVMLATRPADRLRAEKGGAAPEAELVAPSAWFQRIASPAIGEPSLDEPCAERRGRVEERDGQFLHFCVTCGAWGAFGYGVSLRAGRLGRWYCAAHRPPCAEQQL
jgi:hypothetical protein